MILLKNEYSVVTYYFYKLKIKILKLQYYNSMLSLKRKYIIKSYQVIKK